MGIWTLNIENLRGFTVTERHGSTTIIIDGDRANLGFLASPEPKPLTSEATQARKKLWSLLSEWLTEERIHALELIKMLAIPAMKYVRLTPEDRVYLISDEICSLGLGFVILMSKDLGTMKKKLKKELKT